MSLEIAEFQTDNNFNERSNAIDNNQNLEVNLKISMNCLRNKDKFQIKQNWKFNLQFKIPWNQVL